jgi:hypothetical protein
MSTSYRITLRCTDCAHQFKRTVTDLAEADPPCPKCGVAKQNIGLDVAAGRVPAVGGNPSVKAMDFTMNSVAAEYGMTDLRTDAREGETMAPKLPAQQQRMADAMFDPVARQKMLGTRRAKVQLGNIAANAMAGAYKQDNHRAPDAVAALHAPRRNGPAVKANYVIGDGVR